MIYNVFDGMLNLTQPQPTAKYFHAMKLICLGVKCCLVVIS